MQVASWETQEMNGICSLAMLDYSDERSVYNGNLLEIKPNQASMDDFGIYIYMDIICIIK